MRAWLNWRRRPIPAADAPGLRLDAELARHQPALHAIRGPLPAPQRHDTRVIARQLLRRIWHLPGGARPFGFFETALGEMAAVSRSVVEAPHPAIRRCGWEPLAVCTPLLIACAMRALAASEAYQAVSRVAERHMTWQVADGDLLDWTLLHSDPDLRRCTPVSEAPSARAYVAASIMRALRLPPRAVALTMSYALEPDCPRTLLHTVVQQVLDPERVTAIGIVERMIEAVTTNPRYQANVGTAPLYVLGEHTFCVHPRLLEIVRDAYPEPPRAQRLLRCLQDRGLASALHTASLGREADKGPVKLSGFLMSSACLAHYARAIAWPSPTPWTGAAVPYDGTFTLELG